MFLVTSVHQLYQTLYYPTNAHNAKNVDLLKYIKIMKAAPTCFGLQRNHHQGATVSTYLKLQAWFSVEIDVVAFVLCTVHCVSVYAHTVHSTHATQVLLCRHSTDNVCTTSVSTLNQACNFR